MSDKNNPPPPTLKSISLPPSIITTKTTPHLLEHIELQIIKIKMKTDFG